MKIKNINFIKLFENDLTRSKVGKIDMNVINDNSYYSLYYKFPLIEKLVLEIYKLVPGTNVEKYEQGSMRTINSIIKNNQNIGLIPDDIIDLINYLFNEDDNSPRNIVFHELGSNEKKVIVNFEEINYIIAYLLLLLTNTSKEYGLSTLKKIELIKY